MDTPKKGEIMDYHGHTLRYEGFICGDERVQNLVAFTPFNSDEAIKETRQLLRDLTPQGCVQVYYFGMWVKTEIIWKEISLKLYRIKLDSDGEVPEVEPTRERIKDKTTEVVKP